MVEQLVLNTQSHAEETVKPIQQKIPNNVSENALTAVSSSNTLTAMTENSAMPARIIDKVQNIVFDFDSTVIKEESLEVILSHTLAQKTEAERNEIMDQIKFITNLCMGGNLSFRESLARRLKICSPNRKDVDKFVADNFDTCVTDGIELFEILSILVF